MHIMCIPSPLQTPIFSLPCAFHVYFLLSIIFSSFLAIPVVEPKCHVWSGPAGYPSPSSSYSPMLFAAAWLAWHLSAVVKDEKPQRKSTLWIRCLANLQLKSIIRALIDRGGKIYLGITEWTELCMHICTHV